MKNVVQHGLAALGCVTLLTVSGCGSDPESKVNSIATITDPTEKVKAIENSNMSPEEKAKYKQQAEAVAAASQMGKSK